MSKLGGPVKRSIIWLALLACLLACSGAAAQTGGTANSIISAPMLPTTCRAGNGRVSAQEVVVGNVAYLCTATNVWSPIGGGLTGSTGPAGPGIGAWSSATTYATGQVVSYMGDLYISSTNGNMNNLPTDTMNWDVVAGSGSCGTLTAGEILFGTGMTTCAVDSNLTWDNTSKILGTPTLRSSTSNPAAAGFIRLAKTNVISWRNNANSADLALAVNGSDQLTFNGVVVNSGVTGGANSSLTNLSAVAINSALLPGVTNSIALGSSTRTWSDLFIGSTSSYSDFLNHATAPRVVNLPDAASSTAQGLAAAAAQWLASFNSSTGAFTSKTLTSTTGPTGVTVTDTAGAVTLAPANSNGNGSGFLLCTPLGGPRTGDYYYWDGTKCTQTTPGIQFNAQACATPYTVASTDRNKWLVITDSSPCAVTLPQANSTGFDSKFDFCFQNAGAAPATFTPTTSTINGFAVLTIPGGMSACFDSDDTNYFARQIGSPTPFALTDAATVTWAIGNSSAYSATLLFTVHTGARTLNITNPLKGAFYDLKITQDGTGGAGLTLGTGCTWKVAGGGAGAVTPSTGANAIDLLVFKYDGTNCLATITKNFN